MKRTVRRSPTPLLLAALLLPAVGAAQATGDRLGGKPEPPETLSQKRVTRFLSPYGLQKLAAETYCALFHRLYGLPTVALRYFNVFGPRQDPSSDYAAVIPRFIEAVRSSRAGARGVNFCW